MAHQSKNNQQPWDQRLKVNKDIWKREKNRFISMTGSMSPWESAEVHNTLALGDNVIDRLWGTQRQDVFRTMYMMIVIKLYGELSSLRSRVDELERQLAELRSR